MLAIPHAHSAARVPQGQYRLHAKINHLGRGPSSGHHTADIFHEQSQRWLRYNDMTVSELPWHSGEQPDADCYMLVYVDDVQSAV